MAKHRVRLGGEGLEGRERSRAEVGGERRLNGMEETEESESGLEEKWSVMEVTGA